VKLPPEKLDFPQPRDWLFRPEASSGDVKVIDRRQSIHTLEIIPYTRVDCNTQYGYRNIYCAVPTRALVNVTLSPAPGTLKPPAPPETFDQLAVLFQLEATEETQKRFAAVALNDSNTTDPVVKW
jgi:hypothetical protein